MFHFTCFCAPLVDDGSDDDVESGSGNEYDDQSGSGFDEDFFTSDDVTSRRPPAADSRDDKQSAGLGHRTIDQRYACVISLMILVVLLVR